MNSYPTNLTDNQWQVMEKFLDVQVRKRKYPLRNIVNAINYLLKSGCQWRMLPKDFPPYNLVYYYFSKWKNEGVLRICSSNYTSGYALYWGERSAQA